MKITLINPPISVKEVYKKYHHLAAFQPPIGLCSLASYLRKNKYAVNIIDGCVLGLSIGETLKEIQNAPPQLIGIYTNTSNYYVVRNLAASIREAFPAIKIAVGGPHPSALPESTLNELDVDFCVVGEGEQVLLKLVQNIEGDVKDYSKIQGLGVKTGDGLIKINQGTAYIDDLDQLPFPAIDLLPPISNYKLYMFQYKRMPYMTIMTSRGCPYNCIFCTTPFGKKVRFHSPEYITDYISYLSSKYDVKELHFCDDTFTLDENRVFDICDSIHKKDLDVSWYAATRPKVKSKELFKEMKKAGCWICAIGAESGDQNILSTLGKHYSLEEIKAACNTVVKSGLVLKVFFILGSPGETIETMDRTIRFARSLNAHFPVFSLMTPFPGTALWGNAEKHGTFDRSNFNKLLISGTEPSFIPNGLSKEILIQKQNEAFRKTYLNFGMAIRQLSAVNSLNDFQNLLKGLYYFGVTQFIK